MRDGSLSDAQTADAGALLDATSDAGDGDSGDIFGEPLCLCGCVRLNNVEPNIPCEFDYAQLRADEYHHELRDIVVKADEVRARFVPSADRCDAFSGGFFVDDVDAPKTLTLCPVTCERLRATGSAIFGRACGESP